MVSDVSGLTDRELERDIALLMWPEKYAHRNPSPAYYAMLYAPRFSESIDALEAVEAKLREAGWFVAIEMYLGPDWHVEWADGNADHHAYAPTEARARAEAALQALTSITTLASRTEASNG